MCEAFFGHGKGVQVQLWGETRASVQVFRSSLTVRIWNSEFTWFIFIIRSQITPTLSFDWTWQFSFKTLTWSHLLALSSANQRAATRSLSQRCARLWPLTSACHVFSSLSLSLIDWTVLKSVSVVSLHVFHLIQHYFHYWFFWGLLVYFYYY